MGHLINPIGFRLNRKEIKESYIPLYTKNNYRQSTNNIVEVSLYLKQFFGQSLFKKAGVIYSHFKLYESIKEVLILVYLYIPDLIISNKRKFARYLKKNIRPYIRRNRGSHISLNLYKSFFGHSKYSEIRRSFYPQAMLNWLKKSKNSHWIRKYYFNRLISKGVDFASVSKNLRLTRSKAAAQMLFKELSRSLKGRNFDFYKKFSKPFTKYIRIAPVKNLILKKKKKNEKTKLQKTELYKKKYKSNKAKKTGK